MIQIIKIADDKIIMRITAQNERPLDIELDNVNAYKLMEALATSLFTTSNQEPKKELQRKKQKKLPEEKVNFSSFLKEVEADILEATRDLK